MLKVTNLQSDLLQSTSFSVQTGGSLIVTGPSGVGKSLLLRAIADLDDNNGDVSLDGIERFKIPVPQWRKKVAYLPAESGWWCETVAEHYIDPTSAISICEQLNLPNDCMAWEVSRLSTGEKQRLSLVRALENTPSVLLLDEPTSGLDKENTIAVEHLLKNWQANGCILVMVTHDSTQAVRFGGETLELTSKRL